MTIQEAIKVLENVVTFDYTEEVEAIDMVLKALKESKKEGKWKPIEIEELLADEINGKSLAEAISIIGGKLNEVIRRINNERL